MSALILFQEKGRITVFDFNCFLKIHRILPTHERMCIIQFQIRILKGHFQPNKSKEAKTILLESVPILSL